MKEFEIKLEQLPKLEVDVFIRNQPLGTIEAFLRVASSEMINKIFENTEETTIRKISSEMNAEVLKHVLEVASNKSIRWFVNFASLNSLKRIVASAPNSLVERLIDVAANHKRRDVILKALPIERRKHWEEYIRNEKLRTKELREGSREAVESLIDERKRVANELAATIKAREEALNEAEQIALSKKKHLEYEIADAKSKLDAIVNEASEREEELKKREDSLAKRVAELNEEHRKHVQQKIEIKVPEYVSAAVKVLEELESKYKKSARNWSIHGTIVLVVAVVLTIAISLLGSGVLNSKVEDLGWPLLIFVSFKGLIVLSVLGLWARHAFTVSNAYMHEAIKRSDRAHAINFGKLYFEIYGNAVDRSELIEIFENWNIASESAFSKIKFRDQDIQLSEHMKELVKVLKHIDKKES